MVKDFTKDEKFMKELKKIERKRKLERILKELTDQFFPTKYHINVSWFWFIN